MDEVDCEEDDLNFAEHTLLSRLVEAYTVRVRGSGDISDPPCAEAEITRTSLHIDPLLTVHRPSGHLDIVATGFVINPRTTPVSLIEYLSDTSVVSQNVLLAELPHGTPAVSGGPPLQLPPGRLNAHPDYVKPRGALAHPGALWPSQLNPIYLGVERPWVPKGTALQARFIPRLFVESLRNKAGYSKAPPLLRSGLAITDPEARAALEARCIMSHVGQAQIHGANDPEYLEKLKSYIEAITIKSEKAKLEGCLEDKANDLEQQLNQLEWHNIKRGIECDDQLREMNSQRRVLENVGQEYRTLARTWLGYSPDISEESQATVEDELNTINEHEASAGKNRRLFKLYDMLDRRRDQIPADTVDWREEMTMPSGRNGYLTTDMPPIVMNDTSSIPFGIRPDCVSYVGFVDTLVPQSTSELVGLRRMLTEAAHIWGGIWGTVVGLHPPTWLDLICCKYPRALIDRAQDPWFHYETGRSKIYSGLSRAEKERLEAKIICPCSMSSRHRLAYERYPCCKPGYVPHNSSCYPVHQNVPCTRPCISCCCYCRASILCTRYRQHNACNCRVSCRTPYYLGCQCCIYSVRTRRQCCSALIQRYWFPVALRIEKFTDSLGCIIWYEHPLCRRPRGSVISPAPHWSPQTRYSSSIFGVADRSKSYATPLAASSEPRANPSTATERSLELLFRGTSLDRTEPVWYNQRVPDPIMSDPHATPEEKVGRLARLQKMHGVLSPYDDFSRLHACAEEAEHSRSEECKPPPPGYGQRGRWNPDLAESKSPPANGSTGFGFVEETCPCLQCQWQLPPNYGFEDEFLKTTLDGRTRYYCPSLINPFVSSEFVPAHLTKTPMSTSADPRTQHRHELSSVTTSTPSGSCAFTNALGPGATCKSDDNISPSWEKPNPRRSWRRKEVVLDEPVVLLPRNSDKPAFSPEQCIYDLSLCFMKFAPTIPLRIGFPTSSVMLVFYFLVHGLIRCLLGSNWYLHPETALYAFNSHEVRKAGLHYRTLEVIKERVLSPVGELECFVAHHASTLIYTPSFLDLSADGLMHLLTTPHLLVDEFLLFQALVRWARHRIYQRSLVELVVQGNDDQLTNGKVVSNGELPSNPPVWAARAIADRIVRWFSDPKAPKIVQAAVEPGDVQLNIARLQDDTTASTHPGDLSGIRRRAAERAADPRVVRAEIDPFLPHIRFFTMKREELEFILLPTPTAPNTPAPPSLFSPDEVLAMLELHSVVGEELKPSVEWNNSQIPQAEFKDWLAKVGIAEGYIGGNPAFQGAAWAMATSLEKEYRERVGANGKQTTELWDLVQQMSDDLEGEFLPPCDKAVPFPHREFRDSVYPVPDYPPHYLNYHTRNPYRRPILPNRSLLRARVGYLSRAWYLKHSTVLNGVSIQPERKQLTNPEHTLPPISPPPPTYPAWIEESLAIPRMPKPHARLSYEQVSEGVDDFLAYPVLDQEQSLRVLALRRGLTPCRRFVLIWTVMIQALPLFVALATAVLLILHDRAMPHFRTYVCASGSNADRCSNYAVAFLSGLYLFSLLVSYLNVFCTLVLFNRQAKHLTSPLYERVHTDLHPVQLVICPSMRVTSMDTLRVRIRICSLFVALQPADWSEAFTVYNHIAASYFAFFYPAMVIFLASLISASHSRATIVLLPLVLVGAVQVPRVMSKIRRDSIRPFHIIASLNPLAMPNANSVIVLCYLQHIVPAIYVLGLTFNPEWRHNVEPGGVPATFPEDLTRPLLYLTSVFILIVSVPMLFALSGYYTRLR